MRYEPGYERPRRRMVERIREAGVRDRQVLEAMGAVERHRLVPEALRYRAYREEALPIGDGQTISAPGTVARMTEALELRGGEAVLEVGTGSAYQALVLSRLAARVVSVERVASLATGARRVLEASGTKNVEVLTGDGSGGRPEQAPWDAIVVTAGAPRVPQPLLEQLAPGGHLVGPFGPRDGQRLARFRRVDEDGYTCEELGRCHFVELLGAHGWAA